MRARGDHRPDEVSERRRSAVLVGLSGVAPLAGRGWFAVPLAHLVALFVVSCADRAGLQPACGRSPWPRHPRWSSTRSGKIQVAGRGRRASSACRRLLPGLPGAVTSSSGRRAPPRPTRISLRGCASRAGWNKAGTSRDDYGALTPGITRRSRACPAMIGPGTLWDQLAALLLTRHDAHPLGCHRRRSPDRVIPSRPDPRPGPRTAHSRPHPAARMTEAPRR
jgi:hypothetical protein